MTEPQRGAGPAPSPPSSQDPPPPMGSRKGRVEGEKSPGLRDCGGLMLLAALMHFSSHSLGPRHRRLLQWTLLLPDRGDPRHRANSARLPWLPPAPHTPLSPGCSQDSMSFPASGTLASPTGHLPLLENSTRTPILVHVSSWTFFSDPYHRGQLSVSGRVTPGLQRGALPEERSASPG